jgi:hypothetical protein
MTKQRALRVLAVLGGLLLLGATVAWAGEQAQTRRRNQGLRAAGLRVYWSLLRDDQREPAREILGDFLVGTQPDRLQASARLVRLKADVAGILTESQRRMAWTARKRFRALAADARRALVDRMLSQTDRAVLASRVERMQAAAPEARVALGIEILGQVGDVLEAEMARTLGLSDRQRAGIRALYDEALAELKPIALRLATAKAEAVARALALLDADQRTKVELWHEDVRAKVLTFLRG